VFCLYFLPGPAQEMFIKLFILHIFVSNTVPNVDPEIKIFNFYFAFLIDKIDKNAEKQVTKSYNVQNERALTIVFGSLMDRFWIVSDRF